MAAIDEGTHANRRDDTTASWHVPVAAALQPPLLPRPEITLHAAIGSLALGGAERIVLDWAVAATRHYRVRLIVLRSAPAAWTPPEGIEVIALHRSDSLNSALVAQGRAIATSGHPRILCHLLSARERDALAAGGARPVPVVHNARAGWIDADNRYAIEPEVIVVSEAAAVELRAAGAQPTVLRHFPKRPPLVQDARRIWRQRWAVPPHAFCIVMIGGVKPQKAYPRALRILAALHRRREAHLVVLGGPVGRDGCAAWQAMLDQARRLRLEQWVRMPGFVPDAARTLAAFDLMLNTSRYEGVSIATMEALGAGLPVVASNVGGQAEIAQSGLQLIAFDAPLSDWCDAIEACADHRPVRPAWLGFPSARLWTQHHIAMPNQTGKSVLFVTANLNAGGAQRSLVNLAQALHTSVPLEIAVCGDSSVDDFYLRLRASGIAVFRTAAGKDCFDHADAILLRVATGDIGTVVYWNVDPKIKLLASKRLGRTAIRVVDVSPGHYAFEEMDAAAEFGRCIAFDSRDYYASLDRLVMKYRTRPATNVRTVFIPNGVGEPRHRRDVNSSALRVVVSGRIAPSKFLIEIVDAMRRVWPAFPEASLHILGTAEPRHRDYADRVFMAIGAEWGRRVIVHGAAFDAPEQLADFDIALVIGHHQGSPNAVLEAMAAGLVVVANDSGGTRELVVDGRTGLLIENREPATIAHALMRVMANQAFASRLARGGHRRVARRFSMARMARTYRRLLVA